MMKKLLFAIVGATLLFSACSKDHLEKIEQNPYRAIIEYNPQTFTMEVAGNLTPDMLYDWISVTQNGNTATFTVRRNTHDAIRRAEFTQSGSSKKCCINQKPHALDGNVQAEVVSQAAGTVAINAIIKSNFTDDYQGWGLAYSESADVTTSTAVPQSGLNFGKNEGKVTGLKDGVDYFMWAYVESTEGDKVYSDMMAILPPVMVKAGEDLQKAIDNAKEYASILVEGGATFTAPKGGFKLGGKNANKTISGGWDAGFTKQSMNNLTKIDGGESYGFWCAADDGTDMQGYSKISYFEVFNCSGDHGTAFHCVGGPITIKNCYVHDNDSEKGAIGTNEGGYKTTLNVVNCIVADNTANAHGAAFGFGEGKSDAEPVTATLVNNLIVDNVSTKKDGYCSTFICYNQTILVLVNNTIVGNKNWAEYGGPYPGQNLRGDVASCFVNNIIVGNMTSPCTKEMTEPAYERQNKFFSMGGGAGTLANNMIEGELNDFGNATVQDQIDMPLGFDLSTVLTSDYMPLGKALGAGTLGNVTYKGNKHDARVLDVAGLLDTYGVDLAGNPRVVNGKVDLGCYQAQ